MARTKFYISDEEVKEVNQQCQSSYSKLMQIFKAGDFCMHNLNDVAKIIISFRELPPNLDNNQSVSVLESRIELMNALALVPYNVTDLIQAYVNKETEITGVEPDLDSKLKQCLETQEKVRLTSGEESDYDGDSFTDSSECSSLGESDDGEG